MNKAPIAILCPNVPNRDGKLLWVEKPFPEKLNSWPEWTHVINAHAVYGDTLDQAEDIVKLRQHHELVVIISNPIRSEYIRQLIKKIREVDRKKIILLLDGHLENFFDRVRGWDFLWCLNHCDLVALNRMDSLDYVKSLTEKPVGWLSFPVDVDWFSQYKKPFEQRDKNKLIVCAASGSLDIITVLHRAFPELRFVLTERGGFFKRDQLQHMGMLDYVDLVPKVNQQEFYQRVAECFAGVYLDYKSHLGRFPTDCAILDVPCMGTVMTDRQAFLWPDLTIDRFSHAYRFIEFLNKLRSDYALYQHSVQKANAMLSMFNHESSLRHWVKICELLNIAWKNGEIKNDHS